MQKEACRSDKIRNLHRRNYFVTETNSPSSYYKKYIYTTGENLCQIRAERELTNYNCSYFYLLLLSIVSIYCSVSNLQCWSFLRRYVCFGKSPKCARQSLLHHSGKNVSLYEEFRNWQSLKFAISQTVLFPTGKSIFCTANLTFKGFGNFSFCLQRLTRDLSSSYTHLNCLNMKMR